MANAVRGTTDIVLGGKTYEVGFSLGTLARVANVLGVKSFKDVQARLVEFDVTLMTGIVQAFLNGNGHMDVADADVESMTPDAYMEMITTVFSGGKAADNDEAAPSGNAKSPSQTQKKSKAS